MGTVLSGAKLGRLGSARSGDSSLGGVGSSLVFSTGAEESLRSCRRGGGSTRLCTCRDGLSGLADSFVFVSGNGRMEFANASGSEAERRCERIGRTGAGRFSDVELLFIAGADKTDCDCVDFGSQTGAVSGITATGSTRFSRGTASFAGVLSRALTAAFISPNCSVVKEPEGRSGMETGSVTGKEIIDFSELREDELLCPLRPILVSERVRDRVKRSAALRNGNSMRTSTGASEGLCSFTA
jgi:hypothetical protein